MGTVVLLWDFSARGLATTLARLAQKHPDKVFVPGLAGAPSQGRVFRDVVQPKILESENAIAFIDVANINVGFEIGFAFGAGKRLALAVQADKPPEWIAATPLKEHLLCCGAGLGKLEALVAGDHWAAPVSREAKAGKGVLVVSPRTGEGEALLDLVAERRKDWERFAVHDFNLADLPRHLDRVGTVVWVVAAVAPDAMDGRDGRENFAASVAAGFALATGRDVRILRSSSFRQVVDVVGFEKTFSGLDDFDRLLVEIAEPPRPPGPVDPLAEYRAHLRSVHARLAPFLSDAGPGALDDVYVEVELDPNVGRSPSTPQPSDPSRALELLPKDPMSRGEPRQSRLWRFFNRLSAGKTDGPAIAVGRRTRLRDLMELAVDENTGVTGRWTVLGEPGAGKSTVARHLAWELAGREDGPLPVYVSLPRFAVGAKDPFVLAEEDVRASRGDLAGAGLAALLHERAHEPGGVWMLLDGLDEVPSDRAEDVRERITSMTDKLVETRFAVLGRPIGHRDIAPCFRTARLRPLSEDAQRRLLIKWLSSESLADDLVRRVATRPAIRLMVGNPLILTLLALLALRDRGVPDRRIALYAEVIDLLLRHGHGRDPIAVADPESARFVLRELALVLLDAPQTTWTPSELDKALWKARRDAASVADRLQNSWPKGHSEFLYDVRRSAVLADHDGPGTPWRFFHRQFLEFLAAEALAERTEKDVARRIKQTKSDEAPRLAETLSLLCGLGEQPRPLVLLRRVRKISPEVALRALPDVEGLRPAESLAFLAETKGWSGEDLSRWIASLLVLDKSAREEAESLLWDLVGTARSLDQLGGLHWTLGLFGHAVDSDRFFRLARLRTATWMPDVIFVPIPTGTLSMGSPGDNEGRLETEVPVHEVRVREFELATTPVTDWQFRAFEAAAGWRAGDDSPVTNVSWWTARLFCAWIGARLPSEAEWEYACRAGTTTRYWSGDTDHDLERVGWYDGNSGSIRHAVGEKPANPFGLLDMHGNVYEWCEDVWHDNYEGAPRDGSPWVDHSSEYRVVRGGSFDDPAGCARSAYRYWFGPGDRIDYLGFRPARSVTP